jgi:hypothetical protein
MLISKNQRQFHKSASAVSTAEAFNKKTLKSFAEDKSSTSVFKSIDELRKDLVLFNTNYCRRLKPSAEKPAPLKGLL